jgi:hypothetical protein
MKIDALRVQLAGQAMQGLLSNLAVCEEWLGEFNHNTAPPETSIEEFVADLAVGFADKLIECLGDSVTRL